MNERIDPIRGVASDRRVWVRRDADREAAGPHADGDEPGPETAAAPGLPAVVPGPPDQPDPREKTGFTAFAAQVLGQPGQKRGLRGGPETLDKARSAYLETEWSGPHDRRIRRGKITETEI
jgi:hypothetical protein